MTIPLTDANGDKLPLVDMLPRAIYLAEGGELPEFNSHFLHWQEKYRRAAAAVLHTLAQAAEDTRTDEGAAHAAELTDIARQVMASRG